MDTIEELYHGTIQPNLRNNQQSKAYNEAMQLVAANEEKLLTLLAGKEKQLFNDVLTAYSTILGESNVAHFRLGYKLGARMTLDTFADGELLPIITE